METIYDACRVANQYLGMVLWFGVSFRLGIMLFDKTRWKDHRALHIMAWFGWIAASVFNGAFGSAYYAASETPANWTSLTRSILLVLGIMLAIWWPHPHRYKPLETP